MNFKKIVLIGLLALIIVGAIIAISIKSNKIEGKDENKLDVVVTTFSTYDFVKQIAKDNVNVTFLLNPGVESHGYEPTATDLIKIQNSDMFIYVGGEMESWVDKVLNSLDTKNTKLIMVSDFVQKIEEQEIDGAEHEHEEHQEGEEAEFDEHIWTSPANAIKIVEGLARTLGQTDTKNKVQYEENSKNYIAQIKDVQSKIKEIVDNKVRDRLVFGDKMPMQYFVNEFGLKVSAAFSGCSTETEPSSSTIAYLVNKIKEEKIPVVLYIELNTGKVAQTIAAESGAKAMQIQSLHNVSKEDFQNGETYVSLMNRNLNVLKEALQ